MRKLLLKTLLKINNRTTGELAKLETIDWHSAYGRINKLLKLGVIKKVGKKYIWTLPGRRLIRANVHMFTLTDWDSIVGKA